MSLEQLHKEVHMAEVQKTSSWLGWVYFAGILMVVRGLFEMFQGIFALTNQHWFVATQNQLVLFDLGPWGWLQIVMGVLLLTGAALVFSGRMWGRIVGVVMMTVAMFVNLMWLPAYPIWGIILVALDIVVLYALVAHGGDARESK